MRVAIRAKQVAAPTRRAIPSKGFCWGRAEDIGGLVARRVEKARPARRRFKPGAGSATDLAGNAYLRESGTFPEDRATAHRLARLGRRRDGRVRPLFGHVRDTPRLRPGRDRPD